MVADELVARCKIFVHNKDFYFKFIFRELYKLL